MYQILIQTEQAFKSIAENAIVANNLTANVYTGINNEDKVGPAVIIYAESGNEDFPNSGIYRVMLNIRVNEIAYDTVISSSAVNNTISNTIYAAFLNDGAKTTVNSYPNYYVYDFFIHDTRNGVNIDAWTQNITLEVVCALTN